MLKSARIQKSWTPALASEKVGVSLNTYTRWELGAQVPRHASLHALCTVFEMSPAELGFAHLSVNDKRWATETVAKQEEVYAVGSTESPVQLENIALWSLGITSCWQLYMAGGQGELEQLLPDYLTNLSKPTLYPGPIQKAAACLTAQVYQLTALLDLQRGDFVTAQKNGTQALVYSQLAKDRNLYIAAQIRLASIFAARKRVGATLSAYNDALRHVTASSDAISPVLHSWVFAGLAEIQATMGREKEALQFLQLAFTVFPTLPADDPCFAYVRCDHSMLYLYEGLVFLRLGQPRLAWDAFAQVDDLQPAPPERVRAEFLKYKAYTSCILGNMIQSCIYLEAAARAAQEVESDLVFSEVYTLYEHMLAIWGQEARVQALALLFQR